MAMFSWFLLLLGLCIALQYYTANNSLYWIGERSKEATQRNPPGVSTLFVPRRPYLVFSSVGAKSSGAIETWARGKNRSFDLVLYFFENDAPYVCFDYCFVRRDFKWPNFHHFIESNRLGENAYSAALVIDDDFLFNGSDINTFFSIFDKFDLAFAQPSLRRDSDMHWGRHQAQRPGEFFRYISFVENSITALRFRYAVVLREIFKDAGSGYGVDFCMMTKANITVTDVALIHHVAAVHPYRRKVSKASVDFSSEFESQKAFREFRRKYKLKSKNQVEGEKLGTNRGCMFYKPKFGIRVGQGSSLKQALSKAGVHPSTRSLRPRWLCHKGETLPCFYHYEVCRVRGIPHYTEVKET